MIKTFQKPERLNDYLNPLKNAEVLLDKNTDKSAKRHKAQAKCYETNISTLLQCSTRKMCYERLLQEPALVEKISKFLTQVCLLITQDLLMDFSLEMQIYFLAFLQANAVQQHFSQIDSQHGFFQRIKRREAIGENKLQVMLKIQTLSPGEIQSNLQALLVADVERIIYSSAPLSQISLAQYVQNLQTMTASIQESNQHIENGIRQQLTCQDEVMYGLYKVSAYNRFINIGRSLFIAAEQASRDERFKNIPCNVSLDPAFVTFFSAASGLLYLYSTVSQFGVSGTFLLSALTQITSDLEFLTWVGSKMNQTPEETFRIIGNIGHGFSLKDIAQFGVIISQVLMELGDQHNATILRTIAGSIFVFSLAGTVTGYVMDKIDQSQNSKLMPMISICSFFAAMRLISYGLNFMMSGLLLLYQSYDVRYGNRTPEEILMDPVLCSAHPKECERAAWSIFNLPPGSSASDVKISYKNMITTCHPDLSSGDTDCLLKARAAKDVLKFVGH